MVFLPRGAGDLAAVDCRLSGVGCLVFALGSASSFFPGASTEDSLLAWPFGSVGVLCSASLAAVGLSVLSVIVFVLSSPFSGTALVSVGLFSGVLSVFTGV